MMKSAVWIIGDQLDRNGSALKEGPGDCPVVMVEPVGFYKRRPYHWQKLVLIFSAMRHFTEHLRAMGREVHYFALADDFASGLGAFVRSSGVETLHVMEPNDHDLAVSLPGLAADIGCEIKVTRNNQFLIDREEFARWAGDKRSLVMESFYRFQRKRLGILVKPDGSPFGGEWNLDKLNRIGAIPEIMPVPEPAKFKIDAITRQVIDDVRTHFDAGNFGGQPSVQQMRDRFIWPVTAADALEGLRKFLRERLESFGPYEDAMTTRSWSLWHSHVSVAMNCGLLHPQAIIDETLAHALPMVEKGRLPLNSLEGFVRQVIGWREFMRGIYWREMCRDGITPYPERNELAADRPLPDFYWTGKTEMNCMRECVRPVIDFAYAHHIPRLMVLANFALLHGISPQLVNEWFIYAFADGYDWVTTPNVVGMALYADGGLVATKPYAAGGAYIHRMSDYCQGCRFDPKQSTGPDACPFTRAYWPFVARHRKRFAANPRTSLTVRGLDRFDPMEIRRRAKETEDWIEKQSVYE